MGGIFDLCNHTEGSLPPQSLAASQRSSGGSLSIHDRWQGRDSPRHDERKLCNAQPYCLRHGGKFIPLGIEDYTDYLNAVTGSSYTRQDMIDRSEMIETLIRRINIREGIDSSKDVLPKRILEESHADGLTKGRKIGGKNFSRMIEEYYLLRGWDKTGAPTLATIHKYGLEEGPDFSLQSGESN